MLPFSQDIVELSEIDITDITFRITTKEKVDDLAGSIKHLGLINPPVLIPESTKLIVVSGFRRIAAATFLKWEKIPARRLPESFPKWQCAELAVTDNAFQRSLNLVEISRCLVLLSKHLHSFESLTQKAVDLGLQVNKDFCQKVRPLFNLPWSVQQALLSNAIALPTALALSDLQTKDAVLLANLFKSLRCSLNRQRQILTLVSEISLSEDISVHELLKASAIRMVIENPEMDKNRKTRIITDYLKRRRYPAIFASEEQFAQQVRELNLGNRLRLSAPPYFEGKTFGFTLQFDNLEELKTHCQKLNALVENPVLKEIIK
jgi:ParB family chromosome partitioning protein